jgi:hypothetical protein
MRDDLPYFSHDNNAQDHPKMQALIAEYGFEGYGRFWALNERIAAASGAAIDISKKVNKMSLARSLGLNETGIDGFLGFLSDPEIDLVNIDEGGILTTDRTQEDYTITSQGREKEREKKQNQRKRDDFSEEKKPGETGQNSDQKMSPGKTPMSPGTFRLSPGTSANVPRDKTTDRIDRIDRSTKRERENNDDRSSSRAREPVDNSGPSGALSSSSFLKNIKTESEAAGFVIPNNLAKHMADTADPPWLAGPFSYFRFVVSQLRDQYRKNPKTEAELRNLYLSALWNGWESYRKAYPAWRKQQEAAAAGEEAERLKESPPETCPGCGAPMRGRKCTGCGGFVKFQEEFCAWEFVPLPQVPLAPALRDKIRKQEIPKTGVDF